MEEIDLAIDYTFEGFYSNNPSTNSEKLIEKLNEIFLRYYKPEEEERLKNNEPL